MDIRKIIEGLMEEQHVTLEAMGARVGGVSKQSVFNVLRGGRQKTMGVDRAARFLEALGYELVAVPKGSRLPNGGIAVSGAGDD